MTYFEEFATDMKVEITTGENGMYTGMCAALAGICTDVILSDDETLATLPWEEQKEIIKAKFYKVFPYMKA